MIVVAFILTAILLWLAAELICSFIIAVVAGVVIGCAFALLFMFRIIKYTWEAA